MTWNRVQRVAADVTNSTLTVTVTSTGSGNLILVHVLGFGVGTISSITDNKSSTYNPDIPQQFTTGDYYVALYSTYNSASGITSVTFHNSGSLFIAAFVEEWSGALTTTSPFDQATVSNLNGQGGTWSVGPTSTLTGSADLAVAGLEVNSQSSTNTPGSGFSDGAVEVEATEQFQGFVQNKILSSNAAVTATGSCSSGSTEGAYVATYQSAPSIVNFCAEESSMTIGFRTI